jgi:hypothetical protein
MAFKNPQNVYGGAFATLPRYLVRRKLKIKLSFVTTLTLLSTFFLNFSTLGCN